MRTITLAPAAVEDLVQTWEYIAQDDPVAADNWRQAMQQTAQLLASMPEMGRRRDEFSIPLRSFYKAGHVIFYRFTDSELYIVRILHHSRDVLSIIAEEGD
jgi:toxin ParE1/3/4